MSEFRFFKGKEQILWKTAMGQYIPVPQLTIDHINNIITCIAGEHIPNPYLGKTNNEWLNILEKEMMNRLQKSISE